MRLIIRIFVFFSFCFLTSDSYGYELCRTVRPGSSCYQSCPPQYTQKEVGFPYCQVGFRCCVPPNVLQTTTTTIPTTTTTTKRPTTIAQPFYGGLCTVLYPGSYCLGSCPTGFTSKAFGFPFCSFGLSCCHLTATTTPSTTTSTTVSTTTTTTTTSAPITGICHLIHPGWHCFESCPSGFKQQAVGFPYCFFGFRRTCCQAPKTSTTTTATTTTTTTTTPPPTTTTITVTTTSTTAEPNSTTYIPITREYCRAFHPDSTCLPSCPVDDGYIPHTELPVFCNPGLTCCKPPPYIPDPPSSSPAPPEIPIGPDTCGVAGGRTKRSIGGAVNPACSWPWLVSIRIENPVLFVESSHILTGVLITKSSVLVHKDTFDKIVNVFNDDHLIVEALTGEYYLNMIGDESRSDKLDLSKSTDVGDFKILHLPEPVEVGECVRPVCLVNMTTLIEDVSLNSEDCKLVGWGDTESGSGELTLAPVPLSTAVNVHDDQLCKDLINNIPDVTHNSTTVCLDLPDGHIATHGDRGSPIMCPDTRNRWYLMGILVRGNYNTVLTPVSTPALARDVVSIADSLLAAATVQT